MGNVLWMRSIRVSDIFWLLWSYLFIYMSKLINEEMVFFFFLPSSSLVFVERKEGKGVESRARERGIWGPLSDGQLAIGASPTPSFA
jgi:hypothetical protein